MNKTKLRKALETMPQKELAQLVLDIYDAYITPYNGECAYRVLNNDCSCSQYFRNVVDKEGVIPAIAAMPEQFHKCNMAFQELKLRSEKDTTIPACCLASACCADIMMTPVPVSDSSSSNSTLR